MSAKTLVTKRKQSLLYTARYQRYLVEWAKTSCFGALLLFVGLIGRVPQASVFAILSGMTYVVVVAKEANETGTLKPLPIWRWQISDLEREAMDLGNDDTNLESAVGYLPRRDQVEYLLIDAHSQVVIGWLDKIPDQLQAERYEAMATQFNYSVGDAIQKHPHLIKGSLPDVYDAIQTVDTQALLQVTGTSKTFAPTAKSIGKESTKRTEPVAIAASQAPVVDVIGIEGDLEELEEW